ncbi:hypothetical protein DYQ86_23405 [Acidobacteria bacterium AB60]|nr:hypothetical protein DYQ86_23405 [Acidobacteria bacterium AB60]
MRLARLFIAVVVFLTAGLWVLFAYCTGNAGLNFSTDLSANHIALNLTTAGAPMLIGLGLVFIGLLLAIIAFLASIVAQFRRPLPEKREEVAPRREIPFEE